MKSCRKIKVKKSLLEYSEVQNVSETSFNDGLVKGEYKGIKKVAKALKDENSPVEFIMKMTGLTEKEIEDL